MCFTKQFVSLSYGLQILRLALSVTIKTVYNIEGDY